jgi:hypothetical protein
VKILILHNHKGDITASQIVGWLIALAVLVVVLFVVPPALQGMTKDVGKVATCGGVSVENKQGVCIPESQYCSDYITSGCGDYPGRPICCFDAAVVSEVTAARYCVCYESSERQVIIGFQDSYQNSEECSSRCTKSSLHQCSNDNDAIATCVNSLEINKPVRCSFNVMPDSTCYSDVKTCWDS